MDENTFELQAQQLRAAGIPADIIAALVQMYRIVRSIDQASRQPVSPDQLATLAAELFGFRSVVADFNVESSGLRREVSSMSTSVAAARAASVEANLAASTALTRSAQAATRSDAAIAKVEGLSVRVLVGDVPSGSFDPVTGEITITVPSGPAPEGRPVITQQPSISPASATVGDSVTIDLGAAAGADGPATWRLMLGVTDVTDQVDDFMAIELVAPGLYELIVSWANAQGTTPATPVTIMVEDAPSPGIDLSGISYLHFDGPMAYSGPANALTGFTAEGSGARAFTIVGAGAEVGMDPARGPLFASGKYARNAGNTVSIADGVMLLAKVEVDAATATDTVIALTGGVTLNMRWDGNGNRVAYNFNTGGTTTNHNGVAGAVARDIIAMEVDRVTGTIRLWDGEKIVTFSSQTITGPAFTTIDLGNSLTGVITRSNVITRGSGAAWPVSFEDALNEYGAGITPPFP